MSGQLTQVGAQMLANKIAGNVAPVIASSAPTWKPGLDWINTSSSPALYTWNSAAWVAGAANLYAALLTASPFTSGSGGTNAEAVADLVEVTTSGYARQLVDFSDATAAYPAPVSNSAVLTYGPMSAAMSLAAQWAALITHASTGNTGLLLYYWQLDTPQQVSVSQSVQIPIGALGLIES